MVGARDARGMLHETGAGQVDEKMDTAARGFSSTSIGYLHGISNGGAPAPATASTPEVQHVAAVALQSKLGGLANDSCGVRTHALADWRLKPAP